MSEATPRPWTAAAEYSSVVGVPIVGAEGQRIANTALPALPHEYEEFKQIAEANAALIVHAVNNIDRITAERDGLAASVDVLESNARVQAKLLADTGRERDELRKALEFYADPNNWWTKNIGAHGHHQTGPGQMDRLESRCGTYSMHPNGVRPYFVPDCGDRALAALTPRVPDAESKGGA